MIVVKPFQGYHYSNAKITDLSSVICPPYDVINKQEQDAFYYKSPYNFIRLILNKKEQDDTAENNTYTRSALLFQEWVKIGVLERDAQPALYLYKQDYLYNDTMKSRLGFMALMQLGDKQAVYPHENTHAGPVNDRFELTKKVQANLSPIFTIFSGKKKLLDSVFESHCAHTSADFLAKDDQGVRHAMWRITHPDIIEKICEGIKKQPTFIADGHHRYEVACRYRALMQKEDKDYSPQKSYNYVMTYFTPLESAGITIMPIHRLVKVQIAMEKFEKDFMVEKANSLAEATEKLETISRTKCAFGVYYDKKSFVLTLKDKKKILHDIIKKECFKDLDVAYVDFYVLAKIFGITKDMITYTNDVLEAQASVDAQHGTAAFLLRPTGVEQIRDVALVGERMPPKSTYFYPKLFSGLLVHKFQ